MRMRTTWTATLSRSSRVANHRKTAERKAFLENLAKGLSVTTSAKAAKISATQLYKERKADPEFAEAWDNAIEEGNDILEDHVLKMGIEGKNLTALIFLLNGRRPDKFRQRHDLTSGNKPLSNFFGAAMAILEKGEASARLEQQPRGK